MKPLSLSSLPKQTKKVRKKKNKSSSTPPKKKKEKTQTNNKKKKKKKRKKEERKKKKKKKKKKAPLSLFPLSLFLSAPLLLQDFFSFLPLKSPGHFSLLLTQTVPSVSVRVAKSGSNLLPMIWSNIKRHSL